MKTPKLILLIVVVLLFISSKNYATNYYVDPSSLLNTANGTITNPWKTLAQVNAGTTNIQPGDTVFFKRSQVFNGRLVVGGSGTSTKPIVYTSYGLGDMPLFTNSTSDVIVMYNREYIVIDRLMITDLTMSLTDHVAQAKIGYGIVIGNSPNCTISNCDISLVGMGISTQEGSDFCKITGNYIHNLRAVRNTPTSVNSNDDYGATAIVLSSSNNLIQGNKMEDCWCTSYDYGFDGGIVEMFGTNISNNKIIGNEAFNSNGFIEVGSATNGIATNNLVAYNKVINCGLTCCFHNKNTDGFYIRTDNFQFYNNTIIETKRQFEWAAQLFWYADPYATNQVVFKNNIVWVTNGASVVNNYAQYPNRTTHSNNIFKVRRGAGLPILDSTERVFYDNTRIFEDTSSADPINWDFRLPLGSPAINLGTNLGFTVDYRGNPIIGKPDAGIHEFVSSSTPISRKFYVDPSNLEPIANGSISNPWKNIDQVNAGTTALLPGDTVFFKRGQVYTGKLLIRSSGTAAKPIVYTPYGLGGQPEFTNTSSEIIYVANQHHIVINRFRLIDRTMSLSDRSVQAKVPYGIVLENAPNCTISNCDITLLGVGISTRLGSDSARIIGNNIYNMRAVRLTAGGTDDYGANAMVLGGSDNYVANNRIADCWANSSDFGFVGGAIQMYNSRIDNNRFMYNTVTNCNGFLEIGGNTSGSSTNNLIAYNKILNCGRTATFHNKIGEASYINTNNTQIINNVIIETKIQFNRASAMFWFADPTKIDVAILRNNIIWLTTGEDVVSNNLDTSKLIHTNNIYKLTSGTLGVRLNPTELLLVGSAPIFVDTTGDQETWDYRLLPGSPAINFGLNVGLTRDIIGTPILGNPDAGIYEYIPPVITRAPTKYYADPSSTATTANGSFLYPWKTIAQVNAGTTALVAGDSVFFKRGQSFTGQLIAGGSGTFSQPIVYSTYGSGNLPEFTHTSSDVIVVRNRNYVIIDGFKILDKTMDTTNHALPAKIGYGIVLEGSPNCTIRNCDISLVGVGLATRTGSDFTTITNNYFHNMRAVKNTPASISSTDDYGANAMVIGSSNNLITRNKMKGCYANSYDYNYVGSMVTLFNTNMSNNRILYNTAIDGIVFLEIGSKQEGTAINNLIAYNKIINVEQVAIFHNNPSFGNYVSTNNTRFFNNVVVETTEITELNSPMFLYDDPNTLDIAVVRNNIFWLTEGSTIFNNPLNPTRIEHSNNIFKLSAGEIGQNLDKTSLLIRSEPTVIFADTSNTNPEYWNYQLVAGSPAINFGTDVSIPVDFGNNPIVGKTDAGVYEFQTIVPPTPTDPLNATIRITDSVKCFGGTANLLIAATGGTAPYTGVGILSVTAGAYQYIVTDSKGLKDTVTISVPQPALLNATTMVNPYNANTDTTSIKTTVLGGKLPYTYQLNTGTIQTNNIFYGLRAGNYTITVKDVNGCTATSLVSIPVAPLKLKASLTVKDSIKCFGGTTIITIAAAGGASPYSGTGAFTVTAGSYRYIVTDATGKKDTVYATITQPGLLNLNLAVSPYPANSDTTRITATASGGTVPYSYQLNTGLFQSSGTFYNIYAGTYSITVKDANGCLKTNSVTVVAPTQRKDFYINVYPNPSNTYFTLTINNYQGLSGNLKIKVFNANGSLVYATRGPSYTYYNFGAGFTKGTYTLVVELGNTAKSMQLIKM